jgi:hypothetical protein
VSAYFAILGICAQETQVQAQDIKMDAHDSCRHRRYYWITAHESHTQLLISQLEVGLLVQLLLHHGILMVWQHLILRVVIS